MSSRVLAAWAVAVGLLVGMVCDARTADAAVIPDTPLGRRASAWLEAFNSADAARLRAWFEGHLAAAALAERPAELRIARHQQMHADLGDLEATGVTDGPDGSLELHARAAHGQEVIVAFQPAGDASQRLEGVGVRVESGPDEPRGPAIAPPAATEAAVAARVQAVVDSLAARDEFSGAVLVTRGGRTLVEKAWGEADRERHVPNRTDTRFNIGSINKLFTRVAIAQLAEAGKLRLSDTLSRWVPELPAGVASRVTIAQLVAHRSGFGDFFGPAFERADHRKLMSNADYLPLFADRSLEFEPGSRERYSNAGYVLLGLVVERASGESYYDYVRRHVYAPAGMKASDSYALDEPTPNRAVGYTREGGALRTNHDQLPGRGSAAGGGYTTLRDLERFTVALGGHRLLGSAWTAWVLGADAPAPGERAAPEAEQARGGLGVAGGTAGVNAALEFDLGSRTCVVVLANLDPPAAERLAVEFGRWLRRLPEPATSPH